MSNTYNFGKKKMAPYSESGTDTHDHTVNEDTEFLKLNDIASVLTKSAEKCAVNYLVNGHLEDQSKDGSILK
jgi:hypothetical protein